MFWTIRWTDSGKQEDRWVVLEAESQSAAEAWGWKRGVPVVSLAEATPLERAQARKLGLLRKYTPEAAYTCFGRVVGQGQVAVFMLCGIATACLHLRPYAGVVRGWF